MPQTAHAWRSATEQTLRLTTVVWAAAWLTVIVIAMAIDGPGPVGSPVTFVILGATVASWVVLATLPRVPSAQFVLVLAAAGLIAIVLVDSTTGTHGLSAAALWLSTAAVSAAMLFQPSRAVVAIPALSVCAVALAALDQRDSPDWIWRTIVIVAASALCSGLAVWVAASALRTASDATDVEAARLRDQARLSAASDAHRHEVERLTRLLHDTCINTLGAIRNGAGRRDRAAVRDRCAYDLAQMDPLARDVGAGTLPRLPDLAAAASRDGRHLGVETDVTIVGDSSYPINPVVWNAAGGALREALVNVAKHADVPHAHIEIATDSTSVSVTVTDGGPGWDGPPPTGGGIDRSIVARVEHSGGLVRIGSQYGSATAIAMSWPKTIALAPPPVPEPAGATIQPTEDLPQMSLSMRRVAVGCGGWIVLYCAIVTALAPPPVLPAAIAVVVLVLCLWLTARFAAVPQSWRTTALLSIGAAVVVALPSQGRVGCMTGVDVGVGVGIGGATVLVMLVCLFSQSWWQPVMAVIGFAVGLAWAQILSQQPAGQCGPESVIALSLEIVAVVAILSFRRIFDRLQRQAAAMHATSLQQEATAVQESAQQRARDARVRTLVSGAGPLLLQIAEGDLDPADPSVMERAGQEETALRSLLVLNADLGALGDALANSLLNAIETGRRLDIRSGERVPHPTDQQVDEIANLVAAGVASTPRGTALPVALFARDGGGALTIVIATTEPLLTDYEVARLAAMGLGVSQLALEGELLVEVQWLTA